MLLIHITLLICSIYGKRCVKNLLICIICFYPNLKDIITFILQMTVTKLILFKKVQIYTESHGTWIWTQFDFRACEIKLKLLKLVPGLRSLFVSNCDGEFLLLQCFGERSNWGHKLPRVAFTHFYCSLYLEIYFTSSHTETKPKVSGNNTFPYHMCCLIFYILFHSFLYNCCLWFINGSGAAIWETQEVNIRLLDPFLMYRYLLDSIHTIRNLVNWIINRLPYN